MSKSIRLLIVLFGITSFVYSQEPNDCIDATAICGDIDFTYTPTGPGSDDFSSNPNPPCLPGAVESQSVWLLLTVDAGGTLAFTFTPNNGTDDYDWAVYDMNTSTCSNLGAPIRCSSTAFIPGAGGATGLGNGATDISEGPGTGDGFLAPINASPGDVYMVFINNWSATSSGFDLSFGGTATLNPPPTNDIPVGTSIDLEECDNDGVLDGLTSFNLSINTPIIIGAQSGISVTYHTTRGNAQVAANDIPDDTNFQNTISGGQTIFARVTNTGTDCFSITEFEVNVLDGLPVFTAPKINECDDNNDGSWDFDLTQNDAAIINGQLNLQVSYHLTQDNARNDAAPIIGLHPNAGNPQTLWARLESTVNTCFQVARFEIEVYDTPIATAPSNPIQLCDDDNNGTMPFILTDQDAIINTTAGMSVTYYLSQAEADAGTTGALSSPHESGSDEIFARLENDANTLCYDTTSFDIEVYESGVPSTTVPLLAACDNDNDADDTNDVILFNLTDRLNDIILTPQSTSDFTLTYFTDSGYGIADQITGTDITSYQNDPSLNDANDRQTIYVRMTNNLNATCFTDTSFEIEVYELPVLAPIMAPLTNYVLVQCDDPSNDATADFNLAQANGDVIDLITTETFTYYTSQPLAEAGTPGTEISEDTTTGAIIYNVTGSTDDVWVRVTTINGCYRTAMVNLIIRPSAVNFDFQLYNCDDDLDIDGNDTPANDDTDGVTVFDFQNEINQILVPFAGTAGVSLSVHHSEPDADAGINPIDPATYSNYRNPITSPNQELLWVRIVSTLGNDCLANGNFITLNIETLPIANMPTTVMKECDDDSDGMFPFDVSIITSEILNGQSLANVSITYFNEDGTPITGVVNSSLPNPFLTSSQTIDIVVTNNTTNDPDGACLDTTSLTFTVDDSPINNVQPINPECEDEPEDGLLIATFDTSNFETSINAQAGMDITYLDSSGSPLQDMDGNLIVSPFPNSFTTETQTITVLVTNPANTSCPTSVDVDFTVNPRPIFDDIGDQVVCENRLPHRISVENPDANDYNYEWFNTSGSSIGTNQTLSIIDATDITTTGITYSVTVTNTTTSCTRTKFVNLRKSSDATLLDDDIVTIEFNSPANSIEIITTNLGFGDYEYSLEHDADSRPWQDEPIFTNLQGGIYTIFINDKNECGEVSKVIFLLDYPKFLTPNNDGYNDYWQLIGLDTTAYVISPIQIFDRFGKIVAVINPTIGEGWDGLYNNEMLPSSDYWFALSLTNNLGETIIKKGNFSLIRR